jgi:hypothetical protein
MIRMEVFSGDPPCPGCIAILSLADEYGEKYKGRVKVKKYIGQEGMAKFQEYKMFCVPAVVVNEVIKIEGICPTRKTLDAALREGGL